MNNYDYSLVGCAFDIAPILTHVALVSCSDSDVLTLPECLPYQGEWGKNVTAYLGEESHHLLPKGIHIIYLSIIERKFYIVNESLSEKDINNLWHYRYYNKIVVGMAPYGGVALWFSSVKKSILVRWLHGIEIFVDMESFIPNNPNVRMEQLCQFYINNNRVVKEYYEEYGIPTHKLFENYMQQFAYRYLPIYEKWDKDEEKWCKYEEDEAKIPEFEYIEESLYDGTHDKLHDDGLLKYHEAGKPKKLAMKWHVKKSEYMAYFWFDETLICEIFEKFYGAHRDTKTDFIIRIDAEQKKYELALYRYGLKEPLIISEEAYQLLVFKNKFEHYRSENYNQERGAWIW